MRKHRDSGAAHPVSTVDEGTTALKCLRQQTEKEVTALIAGL